MIEEMKILEEIFIEEMGSTAPENYIKVIK